MAGILTGYSQNSVEDLLKKYNSGVVRYISVEQLRMRQLDKEVVIIDSREKEEFQVSHIENAILVGYNHFEVSKVNDIAKDSPIVVYCSLGIRSENIGRKLKKAGYKNVQNLYGGIFEWKNKGFPVVNPEGDETNKVHAFSKTWAKWLKNAEKEY
ncbi:rhodanese-like domain-containing protein [Gramella lutea]|uniref:Rhodanese-like domain-containing protein n=1 Tax=Christiangramia lutea TaxID=1607951 RepID=A0A9X1V127_9FLAO|nr:rhodanese-like domain-containing protein [Christiangramia lutea]MCH4822139.1 rhodanese-like domain-containing protein [Christiangramia lutea]